ncbi:MAG: NTP transferase domain-containing protein [Deltaproteobacteria bacterium]|nr:NTP transferase domain-containing protein [Deltaproteobacteria bacterium]MBW2139966.1 NTP transferase domain-containing protein [Deltaproteobacteria bacterium]MBW2322199.1 NTP transferase domain-containing protein [Deltaproteobacteria bacterium]
MNGNLSVLVLAAGKGTRMKSDLAKVLHPMLGQPMLAHVLKAVRALKPERLVVVTGYQADRVEAVVGGKDIIFVQQIEQLGTGHAVSVAREVLEDFSGTVLILYGDLPLLLPQTMTDFLEIHKKSEVPLSVLTVELEEPGAYGRIIRDGNGFLARIVEARDAAPEELSVKEINTGIYAVSGSVLFDLIGKLNQNNDQQEYYLTDIVGLARNQGLLAAAVMTSDPGEVLGINDQAELARSIEVIKARIGEV